MAIAPPSLWMESGPLSGCQAHWRLLGIQDEASQGKGDILIFFRHIGNKSQTPLACQAWPGWLHSKHCVVKCINQLYKESFNGLGINLPRQKKGHSGVPASMGGRHWWERDSQAPLICHSVQVCGSAEQGSLARFQGVGEGFPEEMTSKLWKINGGGRNDCWDRHSEIS